MIKDEVNIKESHMKKIVSVIAIASMLMSSTAALAGERDGRWGVDANRHSPYYGRNHDRDYRGRRGGVDTGTVVAIGLGALLLGAAIENSRRDRRPVEPQQDYPYAQPDRQVCDTVETRDAYGYLLNRKTVCYYPR